jgi:hypothetical protein
VEVTDRFGEIKANLERRGERLEDFDVAIAAHGLAASAVLVTANRRHMARIKNLRIEMWSADEEGITWSMAEWRRRHDQPPSGLRGGSPR